MSEEILYNIEKIIERRKRNGEYQYKIKWEGYPMSQCTWEPLKNLESAIELVEEYNLTHPIITQKSPKSVNKKKNIFINKKRKLEKDEADDYIKEITQNEIKNDDKNKDDDKNKEAPQNEIKNDDKNREVTQNEIKNNDKNKDDDKNKEATQNEQIIEEEKKISDDEKKPNINKNIIQKQYIIDDSLKSVITVKQQNGKLIAIVNKIDAEGNTAKAYITTEELRKSNPTILLDFYESIIKFI